MNAVEEKYCFHLSDDIKNLPIEFLKIMTWASAECRRLTSRNAASSKPAVNTLITAILERENGCPNITAIKQDTIGL